jgi:hypothetical protein
LYQRREESWAPDDRLQFSYTFTSNDTAFGKVTFQAVASIVDARDALPADNTATALPTEVGK